jgi:hypothetical protein
MTPTIIWWLEASPEWLAKNVFASNVGDDALQCARDDTPQLFSLMTCKRHAFFV